MTKFDKLLYETSVRNQLIGENRFLKWLLSNPKTAAAAEKYLRIMRAGGNQPARVPSTLPPALRGGITTANPLYKTADDLAALKTSLLSKTPIKNWRNLSTAGKIAKPVQIVGGAHALDAGWEGIKGGVPAAWDTLTSLPFGLGGDDNATKQPVQPGSPESMKDSGFADPSSVTNIVPQLPTTPEDKAAAATAKLKAILDAARREGDRMGGVTNIVPQIKR